MLCCSRPTEGGDDVKGLELLPASGKYSLRRNLTEVLNADKFSVIRAWGVIPDRLNFRRLDPSEISGGIETIVCGQDHAVILSKKGQLFTAGNNKYGQCGVVINSEVQYEELRGLTFSGTQVVAVAAGSYHTLLLLKRGEETRAVAFGNYLGCGLVKKISTHVPSVISIPNLHPGEKVTDVFAACNNSACATSKRHSALGRLFMWGELFNIERVLNSAPFEVVFNPPLPEGEKVVKVEFGRRHAVMMTGTSHIDKNRVFSMGHNTYGELGLGHDRRQMTPQEVSIPTNPEDADSAKPEEKKILDITAGSRHSLLLTHTGKIYGFGDNSRGQCGFEKSRSNLPQLVPTQGLFGEREAKARFIFCGETHSAFITTHGELYVWGSNSGQKLGFQTTNDIYTPTLLDSVLGLSISGVGLGGFMTVIITGPSSEAIIKRQENLILETGSMLVGKHLQAFLAKKPA